MNKENTVKKYKVTIFGESYSLVSDEPEELIQNAAHMVDSLMRQIADKGQTLDGKKIAVLVALQLASKTLEANQALSSYCIKSNELIKLIDSGLA